MSKINFRVSIPERATTVCFQSCIAFRREIRRTNIGPILFDSGKYEIPDGFARELRTLLDENKEKHGLRLLFIGHADSNPVFGRLAATLGAGGEDGNIRLSLRRAERVCEYVRDVVRVPADCENIQGRGSSQPVKDNSSDYEKSRNRRVEIVLEYYEQSSELSHTPIHPQVCVDRNALPYDPRFYYDYPFDELVADAHNECIVHTGPLPDATSYTAEAKKVSVSGGRFGFHTLITESLPGRPANGTPSIESEVTIYADATDRPQVDCIDQPGIIASGCYPIEITTDAGSAVRINRTGDVERYANPNNYEHIVVTPYRDETNQTMISGLRVMNDGIEPETTYGNYFGKSKAWSSQFWSTGDPLIIDPRLDVLALDQAVVDEAGMLALPLGFSVYTNYAKFIKGYRLEFFGIDANGYRQRLAETITFDRAGFAAPQTLAKGIDLSPYNHLGYVLKATDCDGSFDEESSDSFDDRKCHIDVTAMRLLKPRRGDAVEVQASAGELWGKSNLEKQTIPLEGGRVRVHGQTDQSYDDIEVNQKIIPVGRGGRFALGDHRRPGSHSYFVGGVLDGIATLTRQRISADATGIEVNGGLFGCDRVLIDRLPGREMRDDLTIPAVTVIADPNYRKAEDPNCPDEIVVKTAEKTSLRVTATGDVRPVMYPLQGDNFQQIVVTPFRDYTDSTVVSAVRISNEGFEAGPVGLEIEADADTTTTDVEANYNFVVALANLTVGANDVSGNAATLAADQHFDGSTFVDGRLAFYAKRKTEDYLLTAQLDSTEDELGNFSDNLKRKDPRRIFRQLDPDRYYPIYGDDSTTTTDVDTQGAFYLRLDWDRNRALWGNFNTGLTDTEFMQYNRSLYGANLQHENQATTKFGDARTSLKLFGSEAQSVPAHVTFKATGGSLYYLRNTDIVQGSEKAWIEVRRKDTEQVVEREILVEGRDYEIDAIQGRMILRRPLSQIVNDRGPSIIRSTPLDGDNVFLLVDYEYVPDDFEANNLTFGGRGKVWINDYVAVGATKVTDQRDGTDYDMGGFDLTIKAGQGTYLSAEFGQSDARQSNTNFTSLDGGLSFRSQVSGGSGDNLKGEATAVEARIDLADVSNLLKGDIRAWSKHRDADFSTGRLGQGTDIDERGFEAQTRIGDNIELVASYTDFDRAQISRERVGRIQADGKFGDFQAGVELRHEDVDILGPSAVPSGLNAATSDGQALLVGARIGYDLSEETTLYAAAQTVADDKGVYRENDLVSVGVNTELSERTAVSLEVSDGDRGSALIAGLDLSTVEGLDFNLSGGVGSGAISQFASRYSIAEGHELYGSYAVNPDRTEGARNLLTLGQRRAFGNRLAIFAESQFGKDKAYANVAHVFGLDFDGHDDWRFSASAQFSEIDQENIAFERQALTLGAYLEEEDLKLSSRLEYREDEGNNVHNRQYLSSNSFTKVLDDGRRWLGQLNLSWTDDELNGGRDARFVELDIGQAYRPFNNDRLNILGKYSFLFDLPSEGQVPSRFDERSHLLSVEGVYDLSDRWELAGKLAIKKGEERLQREAGAWNEFGLRLASIRARYHLTRKWDGLAEYRWLADIGGDNDRDGALLGLYRHVGDNFKVGVGFNFTDFDDRLRIDSYKNHGWFLDLVGKY
jgi:outer membrane protein OmpA-like peptidoglycan-associated protein